MQTLSFPYSPVVRLLTSLFFGGIIIFIFFMGDSLVELGDSPYFLLLLFVAGGYLVYLCYKYFIPVLLGKAAMKLDNEKLQFLITKTVIYWKDVADIRIDHYSNTRIIYFIMMDGGKNIGISLGWIRGDNAAIYNTVVEYFNNAKL